MKIDVDYDICCARVISVLDVLDDVTLFRELPEQELIKLDHARDLLSRSLVELYGAQTAHRKGIALTK